MNDQMMSRERNCFFVADLHGQMEKYHKLFSEILTKKPAALFVGGDIFPTPLQSISATKPFHQDFANRFLVKEFLKMKKKLADRFPRVFIILGNDDARHEEAAILNAASMGIWEYCHNRSVAWEEFVVFGYSCIPPSPFLFKDWERYDVSRFVDPGCIPPEEGHFSIPVDKNQIIYATIAEDLKQLVKSQDLNKAIFLFHAPPYQTKLDRANLDGRKIDHVPVDVHIGSIAIKQFIENREPLLTLHGHVHESARLTGTWRDKIKKTEAFNAAHDGPELAIIQFNPDDLQAAKRILI